ncbi:putative ABC transport system permease protein [Duganella sp. CF458]|uniref:ABC transporter permease n=1 Tax=Duganella sp. CF458 TaxID=1884368 RepID=UPI0008E42B99|nr:ABC transporter permease [Duganella sp. CF458]SFF67187.1 putative ABC transport system permease protein [Duganella sp. CF458]
MIQYYFLLGVRSLRRNPVLTALMVLILAVGVAASVSTLTILHVMSGDPIPHKSERLIVPLVDNGPLKGYTPGEREGDEMSYRDAVNLLASGQGDRRTAVRGVDGTIEPARKDLPVFTAEGLSPTRDFFAMFEVPFVQGGPWSEADDKSGADVMVLSGKLAERLFGNANPVGQRVRFRGFDYAVVGVYGNWKPVPRYHRIIGGPGAFGDEDELYIPFHNAIRHEMGQNGNMNCSSDRGPGYQALLDSECIWIQFWFELHSASDRPQLQAWLDAYAAEQRKLGRLQRNAPNKLFNVMEWLEEQKVVGKDSRLSAMLAFGFLLLCLVNTVGLLLAKFSVRAPEVGVRRALGASRKEIFTQFLIESAVVGLAGGILGLLLALGALALIGSISEQIAVTTHMDWMMLLVTFVMSVSAAMLAGLLPTWRACQVTPALQLKSQ